MKKMPRTVKRLLLFVGLFLIIFQLDLSASGTDGLIFFYSEGCKSCREIKEEVLPALQQKYGRNLKIKSLEISSISNFELLLNLERRAGRKIDKTPPLIFVGQDVLEGDAAIRERLADLIGKYQRQGGVVFSDANLVENDEPETDISKEFQRISPAALILGALADGINPCAFTTLVFLISYLAFIGRKGKQLLVSGFLFCLGVFIAYLLAGIGLMEILNQLAALGFIGRTLRWFVAFIAALLGLLNLYDFFALKSGKQERLKLGLGDGLIQKIHAAIRSTKHSAGHLSGLLLGATVGLLELPCTGQVYFPIIMMVREMNPARIKAIGYLLLYNFIFILPLLAVFVGAFYGLSNQIMTKLVREHLAKVKLLTALFFFGLALLFIWI